MLPVVATVQLLAFEVVWAHRSAAVASASAAADAALEGQSGLDSILGMGQFHKIQTSRKMDHQKEYTENPLSGK